MLSSCWPVLDAWGFTYKTSIVWDKVLHNFGSYVSVRHELLLICTRGSCTPDRPTPMPDSVQTIRRGDVHSEKPEEFRRLIEQLYDGPYVELFARKEAEGWTCWGNQILAEVLA
jgi:N6-adenosine-specific RNA methylase IME4